MDVLTPIVERGAYLPHGESFAWAPGLLWPMAVADGLIALAYLTIPLAIVSFVRKRGDDSVKWIAWLLSGFIFACGLTHVLGVWTLWRPDYGVEALVKLLTAVVALMTAVAVWRQIPRALKVPSVRRMRGAIKSLEAEVRRRKSAEDHVVDIEQSLAATLASIDAGFIATNREGRITRMNAVAERVTGWTQSNARGRSLWKLFELDGRPPDLDTRNPVDALIEEGVAVATTHGKVVNVRNGVRTPLEIKATLTRTGEGEVLGLAMVLRDASQFDRVQAEEQQLAAIVESSDDAIIGTTLDGRITSWNDGARTLLGCTAAEAVGCPIQMLMPMDRREEEMRILAKLAHGEKVPAFDTVCQRKDGSCIDVSATISAVRGEAGHIVGASRIMRDVSYQRRAEARESEARLRFALEAAEVGDWDLEMHSGAMRRSIQHDRCFGYDTLQPAWDFQTFLRHVHPDDRAEVLRTFEAAYGHLADWAAECRVIWPDGSTHWISMRASMVVENRQPARMLGIVSDITKHKLTEQSGLRGQWLEAENRQIQEANRLKSQFLANMSHELRTPLNAIIGFAELLYSGVVSFQSPKYREFLGHIGSSGHHLLQLINDVLDLSKVESGKFEFAAAQVDLARLVKEILEVLRAGAEQKHLRITTDIDPTLTDLMLDPARLKQVLYNYLSNAIKFTPDEGSVTVRARPEGATQFRIEVEDTGMGIAAADIDRLFVEFQQLDAGYAKQHQGTGLGLALTRRLVQAQGGSVGVRSTVGAGSVFHLVLPRVAVASAGRADVAGQRLLMIESDGPDQARIIRALSEAGFQVDVASTGEQALRCAFDSTYDAIALDLALPHPRGLGTLARIRHQGTGRESPVLALTMRADTGEAATFAIADVFAKPIRTHEIRAAMQGLRRPDDRPARVMVIDDDPAALELMRATLASMDIDAVCLPEGRRALREMERHRPDAIILDLMMPEFDGFQVLDALHRLSGWSDTPVFIWTSMILTDEEYATLAQSARAIASKGGGALAQLLEDLRRRRVPIRAQAEQERA